MATQNQTIWCLEAMGPFSAKWHPVAMTSNRDSFVRIEQKMKPKYRDDCRWRWVVATDNKVQTYRGNGKSIFK